MARKNTVKTAATVATYGESGDGLYAEAGLSLSPRVAYALPSAFALPASGENAGRDADHSADAVARLAVQIRGVAGVDGEWRSAQTSPLLAYYPTAAEEAEGAESGPSDGSLHLIAGAGRVAAALMIVQGFQYEGRVYESVESYNLSYYVVSRVDGADMLPGKKNADPKTIEQRKAAINAAARAENVMRNKAGTTGPIAVAKLAETFRLAGLKGMGMLSALEACGVDTSKDQVSRYLKMLLLPKGMIEAIELNTALGGGASAGGLAYSVLLPYLTAGEKGGLALCPTQRQWDALIAKVTYTKVTTVEKQEVTTTKTDLRGPVIRAWYAVKFDLATPTFANWAVDGKTVPVAPLTVAEKESATARQPYSWGAVVTAWTAAANDPTRSEPVSVAMTNILTAIESVVYRKDGVGTMTAEDAVAKVIDALTAVMQAGAGDADADA